MDTSNKYIKMRKQSTKYQTRMREKNKTFAEMDQDHDGACTGCSQVKPTSHSHLIPVSEARELEAVRENITYHCMTCHNIWESHNIEEMQKLHDFEQNMKYIQKVKPLYYNRLTQ